ncbi:MAG: pirin family protein [Planctomycetota bacterium]|nr:pirin family protein [Planctomycetota bacterium]
MITTRKSSERGHTRIDWLDSRHTFSFGEYHDPRHMGFRTLRVLNDDRVQRASGFPTHGHRDMEIVTWVLEGALEHKDSLGNGSIIRPGDVQRMSAGKGILHSEWNPSKEDGVHFLQMWILPDKAGGAPSYEERQIPLADRRATWRRIADKGGRDGSVRMGADASILNTVLEKGEEVAYEPAAGRSQWLHVARGSIVANGVELGTGDALAVQDEKRLVVKALGSSELMLFDLK